MEDMSTKQIGDIAEQAAILQALKRGWGVLLPIGDRLPYDMAFDVGGCLVKIQVKNGVDGPKVGQLRDGHPPDQDEPPGHGAR